MSAEFFVNFSTSDWAANHEKLLIEVSAHPKSIEEDLKGFLGWLRNNAQIQVVDEDGEPSGW